jgi:hypothetical protein
MTKIVYPRAITSNTEGGNRKGNTAGGSLGNSKTIGWSCGHYPPRRVSCAVTTAAANDVARVLLQAATATMIDFVIILWWRGTF